MPTPDQTIERIISETQERPLPSLVPRNIHLSEVSGKANVQIGMRRSGKTYRLFQEMERLIERGVRRSRMLYLNLDDDRLGEMDLGALDRSLELFYRRDPVARSEKTWV